MKVTPIIFSAPMIRALLAGTKTMTRRIAKARDGSTPQEFDPDGWPLVWDESAEDWFRATCPYGQPGDLVWCRETWARCLECGRDNLRQRANDGHLCVYCDAHIPKWRPSIFMARAISRLTLRLTDVRVQRVQEISEEDAAAEGVTEDTEPCDHKRLACEDIGCLGPGYRAAFCTLWFDIHGPDAWARNEWVWALSFEVLHGNVDEYTSDA